VGKARSQKIDVHRVLLEGAPKAKPGRLSNQERETGLSSRILFPRGKNRAKSRSVLEVRLVQERPEYYDAYRRGEYQSITAAATAAGLLQNECESFAEWVQQNHKKLWAAFERRREMKK
jgi:hypothetical protein